MVRQPFSKVLKQDIAAIILTALVVPLIMGRILREQKEQGSFLAQKNRPCSWRSRKGLL